MATKAKALDRTFFDLPSDENTQIDTAELLADLAIGGRMDWPRLLESERILIVSEAGMGKTYECQGQQQRLWEEGRSAFFVELATLATDPLERQFSADEKHRFDNWKAAQTERAFFFLDSVDELKLTQRSFETTLKQFAAALGDNLERACVVLTTRPTAFDLNVVRKRLPFQPPPDVFVPEDYFANVAMTECAGIAYGVATDPNNDAHDRLNGLLALAELQDSRLSELLDLIAASSPDWPEDLARSVIHYLFPKHLLVPQLVKTLARLSPKSREIGGVSTMLPLAIAKAKLEPIRLASTAAHLEAVIELKIGDKDYSFSDLGGGRSTRNWLASTWRQSTGG